jgi:hypothetical protein
MAALARAILIAATLAALFCLYRDRPRPVKAVQVDYCVIDIPYGAKDQMGRWHRVWGKGYGPCSELDRFENI